MSPRPVDTEGLTMMSITKPNSSTQDSGKVRLGAIGRSLPTQTKR